MPSREIEYPDFFQPEKPAPGDSLETPGVLTSKRDALAKLDACTHWILLHATRRVTVTAFLDIDAPGDTPADQDAYNFQLGLLRATLVRNYIEAALRKLGGPAVRFEEQSMGGAPAGSRAYKFKPESDPRNRRITITIE